MTRIVAGTAKGRNLKVPPAGTRPTSARVREALFSKLDHWNLVTDTRVLDLFAGSGALGLEALSRGARHATFIDMSAKALQVVKENVQTLGFVPSTTCKVAGAQAFVDASAQEFDLVFVDPPYDWDDQQMADLMKALEPRLDPDGIIVVERSTRSGPPPLPQGLRAEDDRAWGDTTAWFVGKPPQSA